jgi:type I restriction enzyme M protein
LSPRLFSEVKQEFDDHYGTATTFECFLPVHTHLAGTTTNLKHASGQPNEQYFKWQFLYALTRSGLYAPDYIGTEVSFPKGNKSSAALLLDVAIFDEKGWHAKYQEWHKTKNQDALDWLRRHLVGVIEIKNEDGKDTEAVWNQQLKAYLKESERDFCLGGLYDRGRLWLFRKYEGKYVRFSDEYNGKGQDSGTKDLSLHLPDPYLNLLSFEKLLEWASPRSIDRSKRTIKDLDIISGLHSSQVNAAMSAILRTMDQKGLVNQKGYEILVQVLALKIFDEKRNEKTPSRYLDFYLTDAEREYKNLADPAIKTLLTRVAKLRDEASAEYHRILAENTFDAKNASHVAVLVEVVRQFQDYSFVRSYKTDLYQLVFHRFATQFAKDQNAQFVTPLPLIDFLVRVVNPRNGETVIDPTVGIADFLSVSYVNSQSKLDDGNIYGFDIDEQMVMLATLNMLLNGDGNATIEARPGYGSLLTKFGHKGQQLDLLPAYNKNGDWDNRPDSDKLKKFDVVLTNPPFGEDRAWRPTTKQDLELAECYELWNTARTGDKIDLGVVFLENAVRILKPGGRLGIVLSNSIASIDRWQQAREWLLTQMRLVAIFDLPANVFAETGVNTTVIVAYKPETPEELTQLQASKYKVFFRDIDRVGYEVRTSKRVKSFVNQFRTDPLTFEVVVDAEGNAVLDEEFTRTVEEFKLWCLGQEAALQAGFIKEK